MGRPLNKKYFGNRNVDGIGGGGVATFTVATGGTYQVRPTANVAAVAPGGVTSTGTTTLEVASAVVTDGGGGGADNYVTGDILTVTTASGVATFSVTADGDGVVTAAAPLARGTFAGVLAPSTPATTTDSLAGVGCILTLTYRVKSIQVATAGSGHAVGSTVTITGANTGSAATATVATIIGRSTNQENAIIAYAYVTGGSRQVADIIKQVSGKRYKVQTATGTMICKLKSSASSAAGEMEIVATDAAGNTYYVTKLTAHKATLTRGTGTVYATGVATPWTFSTANAVYCKIPNA